MVTEHLENLSLQDLVQMYALPGNHPNVEAELLSLNRSKDHPRFSPEDLLSHYRALEPGIMKEKFAELLTKHEITKKAVAASS